MTEPAPRDFRPRTVHLALFLMAVGLTIYASFRVVQSGWLVAAGMTWILIGCVVVLVGLNDLVRSPPPRHRAYLLLLANFPVALLCTVSAVDVMSRAEVYITNDSGETMTDVRMSTRLGNRREYALRDLGPGKSTARALRWIGGGELHLEYTAGGVRHEVTLHGYVTGAGEYVDAVIGPGGAVAVNNRRPTFLWPVLP